MRALFFGTPAFAVPCLDALHSIADVVGVVCQPDKPVGRGMTMTPPPVKVRAAELGLPVVQPTKLRTGEFGAWVASQNIDVALVVAYGRILPKDVLEGPRLGCVNVHASLLPKYRGAAPINWAIARGETESGITLMFLDEGMDTGDTLAFIPVPIASDDTAGTLSEKLAKCGAESVITMLPRYVRGELARTPQAHDSATLAPPLTKDDGRIRWSAAARDVHNLIRAMNPWPGATTSLAGKTVKVHASQLTPFKVAAAPGTVVFADKARLVVACGEGSSLELCTVQLEGRKAVRGVEWVMGRGVREGDVLG